MKFAPVKILVELEDAGHRLRHLVPIETRTAICHAKRERFYRKLIATEWCPRCLGALERAPQCFVAPEGVGRDLEAELPAPKTARVEPEPVVTRVSTEELSPLARRFGRVTLRLSATRPGEKLRPITLADESGDL